MRSRYDDLAAIIHASGADVVAVQELTYSTNGSERLISALGEGWRREATVFAKHRLSLIVVGSFFSVVRVHLSPTRSIVLVNVHWWPRRYGPAEIIKHLKAGTIPQDRDAFADDLAKRCSRPGGPRGYQRTVKWVREFLLDGEAVIVAGDFNEPSHLDWTQRYAKEGNDRLVSNPTDTPVRFAIPWKGSAALANIGLRDAYRTVFPDEVKKPGLTWTPPYPERTPGRCDYNDQVLVRLDRIYFADAGLTVSDAAVVGESRDACEIVWPGRWPSDHRAVVATFTMKAAMPQSTGEKHE